MKQKTIALFVIGMIGLLFVAACGQTQTTSAKTTTEPAAASEASTEVVTTEATTTSQQTIAGGEPNPTASSEDTAVVVVQELPSASAGEEQASSEEQTAPQDKEVKIEGFAFSEKSITVQAGATVTWENYDSVPHTVTAVTGGAFDSGTLAKGKSFSYTFTKAGTYTYKCSIHPSMTGTVIVE